MTAPLTENPRLSAAQGALLGCIRHGAKRWGDLSGLRTRTWERLAQLGLLTATFEEGTAYGCGDWKFEITARGKEVYDNE